MPTEQHAWWVLPDGTQLRKNLTTHALEVYATDGTTLLHSSSEGIGGITTWTTGTSYAVGAYVNSGDRLYRCSTAHVASAAFANDAANWAEVSNGANGASGSVQYAGPTGVLASETDFTYNQTSNVLTVPNLWVTGVQRYFDPVDAAQLTADANDYAPFGAANLVGSVWAVSGDAANRAITGITAPAFDGTVLHLLNKGTQPILLRGSNTGSVAANRFGWAGDWTLRAGETASLIYSTDLTRWAAMATVPTAAATFLVSHTDSVRGVVAVNDATTPAWPVPMAGTLENVRVTCGAALAGGDITVTVTRIAPAAFTTNPVVTVASGAVSTLFTPGTTVPVAAGDLLVATVTALTATNVTALSVQFNVRSA